MDCGHVCPQFCHPLDSDHLFIKCHEYCTRIPPGCSMNHSCPKQCYENCDNCMTLVCNTVLPCMHEQDVYCYEVSNPDKLGAVVCKTKVKVKMDGTTCEHVIKTSCRNARSDTPVCTAICGKLLPCGHRCIFDYIPDYSVPNTHLNTFLSQTTSFMSFIRPKFNFFLIFVLTQIINLHSCGEMCNRCSTRGSHGVCPIECERGLICGHQCGAACHVSGAGVVSDACGECTKPCAVRY